ncbi:ABC transporter substrate-binding protein [Burkholderiales bacterium 8X]|nr:ABC transporter substrate-binding protein [Burkholderiales bacterium 8X]
MKRILALLICACSIAASAPAVAADPFPNKPIRIFVGFAPGGGADAIARLLADHLSRTLKQPVLVENRPGANTTLAPAAVVAAPPDGYTLLLAPDAIYGADKLMFSTVKYDETHFTPINKIASTYFVLAANNDAGIKRFSELAARSKQPGKPLFMASPGGTYLQVITADLKRAGVQFDEVPYRGGAPAALAVMAGDAQLTLMAPGAVLPLVREGKITAVGTTNDKPSSLTPGIPPIAEDGLPGFKMNFWYGLAGPAGLPEDVVRKLFDATTAALADAALVEKLAGLGYEPSGARSAEAFKRVAVEEGTELRARVQAMMAK